VPLVVVGGEEGVHLEKDRFFDTEEFLKIFVVLGKSVLPAFHDRPCLWGERAVSYHIVARSGNTNVAKLPNLTFPNKFIDSTAKCAIIEKKRLHSPFTKKMSIL
jgi:hypothetical protein